MPNFMVFVICGTVSLSLVMFFLIVDKMERTASKMIELFEFISSRIIEIENGETMYMIKDDIVQE